MAGCYLPADIFARYHRLKGNRVLMVSGSDMHGTPIMVTAQQEGAKPEEVALRYHEINSRSIEQMGISFDLFTHTHTPEHEAVVHEILGRLDEAGFIEPRTTTAPYDPKAGQFLPDRYVEGTCPHCKSTGARGDQCDECGKTLDADELIDPHPKLNPDVPLEFRETEHLFFRLSAFREQLLEWLSEGKDHWKSNVLKFTRNWLEEGLVDRAITRDLEWGVPVPRDGYESKRIYVWFEAVMGYYSASRHWAQLQGDDEAWRKWWDDPEAEHCYFMAKDNIPFHTIIWPAMLLGCGMQLPHDVPANEYLLLDSAQFSKSRRHAVWIPDFLERYDSEALRYYLAAVMPEQKDASFTWVDYVTRVNTELIGNLGNLLHRVVSFAQKNFPAGLHADECALPALRDRRQDVPLLARHFLDRAAEQGLPRKRLSDGAGPLVVCEGIETGLSLVQGLVERSPRVWAALSTSGMKAVCLPVEVGKLIVARDNDKNGAGQEAAKVLADQATALGWKVSIMDPGYGRDFNDVLVDEQAT